MISRPHHRTKPMISWLRNHTMTQGPGCVLMGVPSSLATRTGPPRVRPYCHRTASTPCGPMVPHSRAHKGYPQCGGSAYKGYPQCGGSAHKGCSQCGGTPHGARDTE
jgi:hypothetical protein